jgi:hypothetical protein
MSDRLVIKRWNGSLSLFIPIIGLVLLPFLSSSNPQFRAPLRITSSPWPGFEPIYLASNLYLSMNGSSVQFHQQDFVKSEKNILHRTGANSPRLMLELTDTTS